MLSVSHPCAVEVEPNVSTSTPLLPQLSGAIIAPVGLLFMAYALFQYRLRTYQVSWLLCKLIEQVAYALFQYRLRTYQVGPGAGFS